MNYVRIGNSGLYITELTFGTALTLGTEIMNFDRAKELIDTAWTLGIRSFDTSNNYGNGEAEKLLGSILGEYNRQDYVIATKGSWKIGEGPYYKGLSRKHLLFAIDQSLLNLKTNYIDIYYAHRYYDDVPMFEIVSTFNLLINTGKVRYWATSEWPIQAIDECMKICDKYGFHKPIADQFIYSYLVRKEEMSGKVEYCTNNLIGKLGYSPLAQGILTGKYRYNIPTGSRISKKEIIGYNKTQNFLNEYRKDAEFFFNICAKYNLKPVHVAINWLIRKQIYPIIGASNIEQIVDNVNALSIIVPENLWNELENYE